MLAIRASVCPVRHQPYCMGMDIWRDIPHAPWSVRRANEHLGDHLDAQAKGTTRRINPDRPGEGHGRRQTGRTTPREMRTRRPPRSKETQSEVASHEVASCSTSELTRLHLTSRRCQLVGGKQAGILQWFLCAAYSGACPMRRYFEGPDGGSDIHFFSLPLP